MSARIPKTVALTLPLLLGLTIPTLMSAGRSPMNAGRSPTAPGAPAPAFAGDYIGAAKCKSCHSSEESGDPYGVWSTSLHSKAFETLESEESKKLAAAAGIADATTADACVKCHVTGHGLPEDAFARGFRKELGVQCETCHGPNGDHMKARFKAASSGEKTEGYQGVAVDEVILSPGVEVCVQCHNPESPSYKPFCYYEGRGEIAHLDPRKPRTPEELASYGTCPHGDPCPHAEGCPEGTCNLEPDELAAMKE